MYYIYDVRSSAGPELEMLSSMRIAAAGAAYNAFHDATLISCLS